MPHTLAILGASSQLAGDYIAAAAADGADDLMLFARDVVGLRARLAAKGIADRFPVAPLDTFGNGEHRAVLNFIGVGDPARASALGAAIFEVTRRWDERVLAYLDRAPDTRYVFMSSGAVYGDVFDAPAGTATLARYPINALGSQNWYALAKLGAEAGHRARQDRSIVDLRVFNYISPSSDSRARFLVTDAVRAIAAGEALRTLDRPMTRDYLGPVDLHALIDSCLGAPPGINAPADAYSTAPIAKDALLTLLGEEFGLRIVMGDDADVPNATGAKSCYYSLDRTAAAWGYEPRHSSADTVRLAVAAMLKDVP